MNTDIQAFLEEEERKFEEGKKAKAEAAARAATGREASSPVGLTNDPWLGQHGYGSSQSAGRPGSKGQSSDPSWEQKHDIHFGAMNSILNDRRSTRSDSNGANNEDNSDNANKDSRGHGYRRRRSRSPQRNNDYRGDRYRRDRSRDDRYRPDSRRNDDYRRDDYRRGGGDRYRGRERSPDSYNHDSRRREGVGHGRRKDSYNNNTNTRDDNLAGDAESESKTVFVMQLANRLKDSQFRRFFEQVGVVRACRIVKDKGSNRSKGIGYVEFEDESSVEKAINLTGHKLMDVPIIVMLSQAEKNRKARAEPTPTASNGMEFHRLYVGNIAFSVSEDDLRGVFEPFGELDYVQLQIDEKGRSKGYGFVQYAESAAAKEALERMQGFNLAGRQLRVGLGSDRVSVDQIHNMQGRFNGTQRGSDSSGLGGRGQAAGGMGKYNAGSARDADKTGGASALEDSDVNGVNFANVSRHTLMQKLARTEDTVIKDPVKQTKKSTAPPAAATRCICVKNCWDEKTTQEYNWRKHLEADLLEESNTRYGAVTHIAIDSSSTQGEVYLKYEQIRGAEAAYRGLNGRFYDSKFLVVDYVVDAVYNAMYPKAAKV